MTNPSSDQYSEIDFSPLAALAEGEVVTRSRVRDIRLPSGKVLALLTLDNGRDHNRPNTLGPTTLKELGATLETLKARAAAGEIQAVGITGKQYILAAGADLSDISRLGSKDNARLIAQLGHHVFGKLTDLGVPSFAFVNGLALGGGLEIALNSTYRTVDASAAAIALPEVFLGIIPGWGGAYLLPNLIGIENALEVVISNPLKQNRMLKPQQAFDYGIVDAIFPAANYLEDSLRWADGVLGGSVKVHRKNEPGKIERLTKWPIAIKMARGMLESKIGTVPKSPYAALELLDKAKSGTKAEGFAREDEALAELVTGDQFAASMYAFDLVQKRAKRPVGAPDKDLAKKVTKVGIIGAGLMASQFALLFVRKLQVPVLITDLDQARVDQGVASHPRRDRQARGEGPARRRHREQAPRPRDRDDRQDRVRGLRLRDRGRLRRGRREAGRLRRDRADRRRRRHPRDEHVFAVGRGDRSQARTPRAAGRLPLLQSGRGHAADRDREDSADDGCRALDRVRRRARAGQECRAHRRCAGLRGEPPARQGHGRGGDGPSTRAPPC